MGKPITPECRARLIECLRDMYAEVEDEYPGFVDAASSLLPGRTHDANFDFVVRSLWMSWVGDLPADWKTRLPALYADFVRDFDWSVDGAPEWINKGLLHRTLSVWQRRAPYRMNTRDALGMILRVGQLHDVAGGAA